MQYANFLHFTLTHLIKEKEVNVFTFYLEIFFLNSVSLFVAERKPTEIKIHSATWLLLKSQVWNAKSCCCSNSETIWLLDYQRRAQYANYQKKCNLGCYMLWITTASIIRAHLKFCVAIFKTYNNLLVVWLWTIFSFQLSVSCPIFFGLYTILFFFQNISNVRRVRSILFH